jgi:hypothetical protein
LGFVRFVRRFTAAAADEPNLPAAYSKLNTSGSQPQLLPDQFISKMGDDLAFTCS